MGEIGPTRPEGHVSGKSKSKLPYSEPFLTHGARMLWKRSSQYASMSGRIVQQSAKLKGMAG